MKLERARSGRSRMKQWLKLVHLEAGANSERGVNGAVFTPPKPMRSPIFQPSATGSIGCLNQIVGFCAKADVALPAPPHLSHSDCQLGARAQLLMTFVSPAIGPTSTLAVPVEVILRTIILMSPPKDRFSTSTVAVVSPRAAARITPVAFTLTLVLSE